MNRQIVQLAGLLAMKALGEEQILYEVCPESPQYQHFCECPKRSMRSECNDYKYFLFDREREKEWSHHSIHQRHKGGDISGASDC